MGGFVGRYEGDVGVEEEVAEGVTVEVSETRPALWVGWVGWKDEWRRERKEEGGVGWGGERDGKKEGLNTSQYAAIDTRHLELHRTV